MLLLKRTTYMVIVPTMISRLTYVKDTQPKATIYFKHAMARVTMRIKKATDNENTYKFPYINLLNVDKVLI